MRAGKKRFTYSRKHILQVLRMLNELVVSLDRVGSASYDMTKAENDAVLSDFITRHKIGRKAALARRILSEPFSDRLDAHGTSELEREMRGVRYWRIRKNRR